MRLEPIESPKGLIMKVAYFLCKRQLGKVITPLKVVYARVPSMLGAINKFMMKGTHLDAGLLFLLKTHTAKLNNCNFCVDIAQAMALHDQLALDKVHALHEYATSPLFSGAERAALQYIKETTVDKKVTDETFASMKAHFSDIAIAEITVVNAAENFYNMINIPLEIEADGLCALVPGQRKQETTSLAS